MARLRAVCRGEHYRDHGQPAASLALRQHAALTADYLGAPDLAGLRDAGRLDALLAAPPA